MKVVSRVGSSRVLRSEFDPPVLNPSAGSIDGAGSIDEVFERTLAALKQRAPEIIR